MMLPGPERFFHNAKCILPWHDEPDSPLGISNAVTSRVPQEGHVHSDHTELSPHSALPLGWQDLPKSAGVTIRVQRPSLTVGHIVHHCKDWSVDKIEQSPLSQ